MLAATANADGVLKIGMFVRIMLDNALQVAPHLRRLQHPFAQRP